MPEVLEPLTLASGAHFDLIPVENGLFGPRVTTAGLLPGAAMAGISPARAAYGRRRF
jgi:hypothetical protein